MFSSCPETFGSRWHHFLSVGGSGTRGVSGDGTDPVWYYGGGSCAVPEEDRHGEGHLSGHPGLRHSLLDVLYSSRGHWEVQHLTCKIILKCNVWFHTCFVVNRRFSQNTVAQLWYFVKCIYFGLSAYQIRCGYPTRVLGNFLTKSYNYVNLFLFQG